MLKRIKYFIPFIGYDLAAADLRLMDWFVAECKKEGEIFQDDKDFVTAHYTFCTRAMITHFWYNIILMISVIVIVIKFIL